jgi:hypothetical protein
MKTKQIFISVLCLILGFGLGFMYQNVVPTGTPEDDETLQNDVVAGEKEILPKEISTLGQGQEVKQMIGKIKAISGNTITFAPESLYDPTLNPNLKERTVTIQPGTRITLLVQRDPELVKKELEERNRVIEETKKLEEDAIVAGANPALKGTQEIVEIPDAPVAFDSEEVGVTALEAGQTVSVTASADVRTVKSFDATWLQIIPPPPVILP